LNCALSCSYLKSLKDTGRFAIVGLPGARIAHVDLGLTNDSAGVAVGWVSGFTKVHRTDLYETLPVIELDLVLEVKPPRNGEISFESIRRLFYRLRDDAGVNLKWISYDTFQSRDSVQILSTWPMSSPRLSAAICANAVVAPWPMSCAPISIAPLPSLCKTALAWA
jgi:hypothetical protein